MQLIEMGTIWPMSMFYPHKNKFKYAREYKHDRIQSTSLSLKNMNVTEKDTLKL
jgi:hypothetical protein